jgi:hypothetical protein
MKRVFYLANPTVRANCKQAIDEAPEGYRVEIRERTRSLDQNAKFHAMCDDVSRQALWMGKKLKPEQWKVLFISGHSMAEGLRAEIVAGIEGEYVNIRESSARMSTSRMISLIEYVQAWCSENNILCDFERTLNAL